jgi:hypothetical protein
MPGSYATCTARNVSATPRSVFTAALQNAVGGNSASAVRTGSVALSRPSEPMTTARYISDWQIGTVPDLLTRVPQPHYCATGASNGSYANGARPSGPESVGHSRTSGLPPSRVGGGGRGPSGLKKTPVAAPNSGLLAPGVPATGTGFGILQTGMNGTFPRAAVRGALGEHDGFFASGVSRAPGGFWSPDSLLPSDLLQELGPRN